MNDDIDKLNPRFVLWLKSRGLTPDQFAMRDDDGEITRIEDAGSVLSWTVVFSHWIQDAWSEFRWLHRVRARCGWLATDEAQQQFDAWLTEKVG